MNPSLLLPILLAGVLAGCAKPGAYVSQSPVVGAVAQTLPKPDGLDRQTSDMLRQEGLLGVFRRDPAAAVRQLHERWKNDLSEARSAGLAAVCAAAAGRCGAKEASGFHLAAAEFAWPLAIAEQSTEDRRRGRAIHSHCSGEMAERLFEAAKAREAGHLSAEFAGPLHSYRLRVTTPGVDPIETGHFDSLTRSNQLKLRNMDIPRHRVEGLGADLVANRATYPEHLLADPLVKFNRLALPVNGNLVFGRGEGLVDFELRDLTLQRSVSFGGRSQPLSADYTAPFAVLANHTKMVEGLFGIKALINSSDHDQATGIYQIEPWRKDQIPVIFVHGLASSPATWLKIINEFEADPELQETYQFLAFRYPTGYPILRNAATLRRHLKAMRDNVDPGGNNPAMDKAILVGHSMGGILSNLQLRSSGKEFHKVFFDRPFDELDLTAAQRRSLREVGAFRPDPNIRRAVFIASPHRGSEIAGNTLGRLGRRLLRLPLDIVSFGLTGSQIKGTTRFGTQVLAEGSDSIVSLKANNPILTTTLGLPLGPGVHYHSIIANHGMTEPLAESSDGFVDYWSSHLDGATSEKVVDATHTSVLVEDAPIEELRRLLYLHAGLDGRR